MTDYPASTTSPLNNDLDGNGRSLANMKLGQSLPFKTVGPYDWCDFKTDGTNDQVEIQQALDTGYPILLAPGIFYIASTVNVHANSDGSQVLYGSGPVINGDASSKGTTLMGVGQVSPILQVGDASHVVRHLEMGGFLIDRDTAYGAGTIGLHVKNQWGGGLIRNVRIRNSETCCKLGDYATGLQCAVTTFEDCYFGGYNDCLYGFHISYAIGASFRSCNFNGYGGASSCGFMCDYHFADAWFSDCYFGSTYSPNGFGLNFKNGIVLRVMNCQFEEGNTANINIGGCLAAHIIGCNIGGAGHTGLGIRVVPDYANIQNVRIVGCDIGYYNGPTGIYVATESTGRTVTNVMIADCNVDVCGSGWGIDIWNVKHATITGNTVWSSAASGSCEGGIRCGSNSAADLFNTVTGNVVDLTGRTGCTGTLVYANNNRATVTGNTVHSAATVTMNGANYVEANNNKW